MSPLSRPPAPDYRRILTALTRTGVPDRVPFVELLADAEMVDAVNARCGYIPEGADLLERDLRARIHFWYTLGFDYLPFVELGGLAFPTQHLLVDDTAALPHDQRAWIDEHTGPVTTWAEFERYPWPDPAQFDTRPLELAARLLPEGMCIASPCHSIFENVSWLMGYETLCYKLYDEPALVEAMFERVGALHLAAAQVIVQCDRVKLLFGGDDMGFKTGTMIGPKALRAMCLPWHKRIAQVAHAHGMPYVLHSCGNLDTIMCDLIEDVQIDAAPLVRGRAHAGGGSQAALGRPPGAGGRH